MVKQIDSRSSASLFASPVSLSVRVPRSTILVSVIDDVDGSPVVVNVCVEDEMKKIIPLNFFETKLSTLVDKGVDSHALNIVDGNKLGIDSGVEALAEHLINNVDKYVESSSN